MEPIGKVAQIWRYPVKSMRSERLQEAAFDAGGMAGDRRFAFTSTAAPAGKPLLSSRERTGMLRYAPHLQPAAQVNTPEGRELSLASPALIHAIEAELGGTSSRLALIASPGQPLTDVRPVSLVSVATLRRLNEELGAEIDPQRFRSNLIVAFAGDQPFAEDERSGTTLRFGETGAVLRLRERIPRCRIVSLDPQTTAADPQILRHLAQSHEGRLGVYATVVTPGPVRADDAVYRLG